MRKSIELSDGIGDGVEIFMSNNKSLTIQDRDIVTILTRKQWEIMQEKANNMFKIMDDIGSKYGNETYTE